MAPTDSIFVSGHQPAATLLDPPAQGEPPAPPCCNHFMRLVCPRCEGAKRGEGTLFIAPYVLQDEVREKKRTLSVQRLVERFDRRGTEPFELFSSEFGQNSWNP